jgi:hypothetical protein
MARLRSRSGGLVRARQLAVPPSVTLVCPLDATHRFTVTPSTAQMFENYKRHFEGTALCNGFPDDSGNKVGPHTAVIETDFLLPQAGKISLGVSSFFGTSKRVFVSHVAGDFGVIRKSTGNAFYQLRMNGPGGGTDRRRNPDLFRWYNAVPLVAGSPQRVLIGKQGGNPATCFAQPDNPPFAIVMDRVLDTIELAPFESTQAQDILTDWAITLRGYL